jgi:predicted dinucleotide-binding enzyme
MKIAFIGIGNVGFALANNLYSKNYEIIIAHNNSNSESVQKALKQNKDFVVLPVQAAVDNADIVFLATPFQMNQQVLEGVKFNGKVLVDCTNPVGMDENGLKHGLDSKISGSEIVQQIASDAKIIKAFTVYGFENFINASFPKYNVKPAMFIASNFIEAKQDLKPLVNAIGFDMIDTGNLKQSLHLEHMTLLWVEMVRVNGHHPDFVWAYLEK